MIEDFKEEHFIQVKEIIHENFKNPWSDSNILFKSLNSIKKVAVYNSSTVIGFIDGHVIQDEADLLMLVVRKAEQGKGIGKSLLSTFINEARKKEVKKIFLEVSEKNIPAINLYKKFGFKQYGKRIDYYGSGENAILMKLSLNGAKVDDED